MTKEDVIVLELIVSKIEIILNDVEHQLEVNKVIDPISVVSPLSSVHSEIKHLVASFKRDLKK